MTNESSHYGGSSTINLGSFNSEKLDCFAGTIKLAYSDSDAVIQEKYEIDEINKHFKVTIKKFPKKQCEAIKVTAVLENIFGESILEKEFKLPDTEQKEIYV